MLFLLAEATPPPLPAECKLLLRQLSHQNKNCLECMEDHDLKIKSHTKKNTPERSHQEYKLKLRNKSVSAMLSNISAISIVDIFARMILIKILQRSP